MDAREAEDELIARCVAVAAGETLSATGQREANVFRVAGMIIGVRYRDEARRLIAVSDRYFDAHPDEIVEPGEAVRRNWIVGFPRLRDLLYQQLSSMPPPRY